MTPGQAKKLLKCSYTTLHNYVDRNIIKAKRHPVSNQLILNDSDVLKLAKKIDGTNMVLLENNDAHSYKLSKKQLDDLKKTLKEGK